MKRFRIQIINKYDTLLSCKILFDGKSLDDAKAYANHYVSDKPCIVGNIDEIPYVKTRRMY